MIQRRPATDADRRFLKRLNQRAYEPVVTAQFGDWDEALQGRIFAGKWSAQRYQTVEKDGQRVGAICVLRAIDHVWLGEIQIAPAHQNQGVGTRLLRELIGEARALGVPLRLRVLIANRAKALYEQLGFVVVGRHEDTHFVLEHRG